VRQEFAVKNSCKLQQNFYSTKILCVETSNTLTKDMAESSQNNLRIEATKCNNLLLAPKKIIN